MTTLTFAEQQVPFQGNSSPELVLWMQRNAAHLSPEKMAMVNKLYGVTHNLETLDTALNAQSS